MDLRLSGNDACPKAEKFGEVAAIEWEVLDLLLGTKVRDRGCFTFQQLGGGLDIYCLRGFADVQDRIGCDTLANLESDMLLQFPKPRRLNFNFVVTRGKRGRHIKALGISRRTIGEAGRRIADRDLRGGNYRS